MHVFLGCDQPILMSIWCNSTISLVVRNRAASSASAAETMTNLVILAIVLNTVLNSKTGALMEMWHLITNPKYKELWGQSHTTELGCLAQGIPGKSPGINTFVFIGSDDVPITWQKDITYEHGPVCVNYWPEKADPNHTRLTVGSDCINYPRDCGTPIINMVTVKIHFNSVISTQGAQYCTIDLKDFYL